MEDRDKYRETKISRGELIDRIRDYKAKDWEKALMKLGVIVRREFGRGHHIVAFKDNCPPENRNCVIVTLAHLHSEIQRETFKKVLTYGLESGKYNEDDIWKALGIKV